MNNAIKGTLYNFTTTMMMIMIIIRMLVMTVFASMIIVRTRTKATF